MNIAFRCDASTLIGHGHVMRCLTLADELRLHGGNSVFLCREHAGNLNQKIIDRGYDLIPLALQDASACGENFKPWLGDSPANDAIACRSHIESRQIDYLVTDHYDIEKSWQQTLRPYVGKILAIDDLANRELDCDVLLDQTFKRQASHYDALTPAHCKKLCGSDYALLKPAFKQQRSKALAQRAKAELKRVLVFVGGGDHNNLSRDVLRVLAQHGLARCFELDLVLGAHSAHRDSVFEQARQCDFKVKIHEDVEYMADLIAGCDAAIGAAGSSIWERACLGLPSIIIKIADNQQTIFRELSANGAAITIESITELPLAFEKLLNTHRKLAVLSASLVDGYGSERVASALLGSSSQAELRLRPVSQQDLQLLFDYQQKCSEALFPAVNTHDYQKFANTFATQLNSKRSAQLIIDYHQELVGYLRFDFSARNTRLSLYMDTHHTDSELATRALNQAVALYGSDDITLYLANELQNSVSLPASLNSRIVR